MPNPDQLLRAEPGGGANPLQMPLMGAWFCKNFSPWLMPILLGLSWLAVLPLKLRAKLGTSHPRLEDLVRRYPTSLYPSLAVALQLKAFEDEAPGSSTSSLNVGLDPSDWTSPESSQWAAAGQVCELPVATGSVDLYRLNNVIHQVENRQKVLDEAARVVKPSGYLQLTDNTREWVDSMWTVKLARLLGRPALAERLLQDKLRSSGQNLAPSASWWQDQLPGDDWELVRLRPFFSSASMTLVSVFESLNYKQGGSAPDWLSRRITGNVLLRPVYNTLLQSLAKSLVGLDGYLSKQSGAAFLLVTLRRKETLVA